MTDGTLELARRGAKEKPMELGHVHVPIQAIFAETLKRFTRLYSWIWTIIY